MKTNYSRSVSAGKFATDVAISTRMTYPAGSTMAQDSNLPRLPGSQAGYTKTRPDMRADDAQKLIAASRSGTPLKVQGGAKLRKSRQPQPSPTIISD